MAHSAPQMDGSSVKKVTSPESACSRKAFRLIPFLEAIVTFMRNERLLKKQFCTSCDHMLCCPICPAGVYFETGTFCNQPQKFCQLSKELTAGIEEAKAYSPGAKDDL
jgi:hypothetical protein